MRDKQKIRKAQERYRVKNRVKLKEKSRLIRKKQKYLRDRMNEILVKALELKLVHDYPNEECVQRALVWIEEAKSK